MSSHLFGVARMTLVVVSITFVAVTAVAAWMLARRRAGVSPVTASREE